MEEKVLFEQFLYGEANKININDVEFCIDRIFMLPKIRPHKLEKAVSLLIEYCQIDDFRQKILEKSNEYPFLIYQLYKRGVLVYEEIIPLLKRINSFLLCYYFQKEIEGFEKFIKNKRKPSGFDDFFIENHENIHHFIEYGFVPSSIEYLLKYDVINSLVEFNTFSHIAKWSPFEWSFEPKYLDLLSFSGFFGSIKCFKYLLIKGFEINVNVLSNVVCSGCPDLFHLCKTQQFLASEFICKASEYCQLQLLVFMLENGLEPSTSHNDVEHNYLL